MGKKLSEVEARIMLELKTSRMLSTMDLFTRVSGDRREIQKSLVVLQDRQLIKNVEATGNPSTTTWRCCK